MENQNEQQETEGRIQAECFQWFNNNFPNLRGLMYHVPNGGLMKGSTGNRLKAMGVVAGVPDLEFHFWKRTFFLECKTPTGRVSKEQVKIHSILDDHGFRVFVFRSLEDFKNIIWAILQDKSNMYARGMNKKDFDYRNGVFSFLYSFPESEVQILNNLVAEENLEKFKGLLFEFINDNFDRLEGFELLFTPDYLGFYKKSISAPTEVHYNGQILTEVPNGK